MSLSGTDASARSRFCLRKILTPPDLDSMGSPGHSPALSSSASEADLDGTWYCQSPTVNCGWEKHLPVDVIRHVPLDAADDLKCAAGTIVSSVEMSPDAASLVVRYHQDLRRLDWNSLVSLCPADDTGHWSAAVIGMCLASRLEQLHDAQLPQVVIHPGRVGQLDGRLVLIPTAASPLPPYSWMSNSDSGRLTEYLAPEVLCTRAFVTELLYSADVYSLGRLLANLLNRTEADVRDVLAVIESRVEDPEHQPAPVAGESPLAALINRMCSRNPDIRPALPEVVQQCREISESLSPVQIISSANRQFWILGRQLTPSQSAAVEKAYHSIQAASAHQLISVSESELKLMELDIKLMRQPGEAGRVIPSLKQMPPEISNFSAVRLRLARAYLVFEGASDHLDTSTSEYLLSAEFSGWDTEIVQEWSRMLTMHFEPAARLHQTHAVPFDSRSPELVRNRVNWWREIAEPVAAWHEIAAVFSRIPFDQTLFDLAREVSLEAAAADLLQWMTHHRTDPGSAAPRSLVWERLGNPGEAKKLLTEAQSYRPPAR